VERIESSEKEMPKKLPANVIGKNRRRRPTFFSTDGSEPEKAEVNPLMIQKRSEHTTQRLKYTLSLKK
jgi:hypothetical protein